MIRGTAAKNVRRKSAIERIERNVEAYNRLIPTLNKSDEDDAKEIKKLEGKLKAHKLTIENTMKVLKKS